MKEDISSAIGNTARIDSEQPTGRQTLVNTLMTSIRGFRLRLKKRTDDHEEEGSEEGRNSREEESEGWTDDSRSADRGEEERERFL